MTCDDADLLLAVSAVGPLETGEAASLAGHLRGCPRCRAIGAEYRQIADVLPLAAEQVEPSPEVRSRLLAQVYADASGQRLAGRTRPPLARRLWARIPARRWITVAGALGTAAATAAAAAAALVAHGRTGTASAPVTVRACGSAANTGACGVLTYDPASQHSSLIVSGLPAIPSSDGRPAATYEVWLVRADHSVVPAAYLTLNPSGTSYDAALEGDLTQFAVVAATREPAGGSTLPTGAEVLHLDLRGAAGSR